MIEIEGVVACLFVVGIIAFICGCIHGGSHEPIEPKTRFDDFFMGLPMYRAGYWLFTPKA